MHAGKTSTFAILGDGFGGSDVVFAGFGLALVDEGGKSWPWTRPRGPIPVSRFAHRSGAP